MLANALDRQSAMLTLRWQRMELLASNIANASTPGYQARDLDFRGALALVLDGEGTPRLQFRIPVQSSRDGNTVELDFEQTAFADNAVRFRAALSHLQSSVETLTRALKGETA